jgi:predicted RNase H-like HicB family nuclease
LRKHQIFKKPPGFPNFFISNVDEVFPVTTTAIARIVHFMIASDPAEDYFGRMKLRLVVEHDTETDRWSAVFPELPGCASAGDTEDEAIRNATEALELWFEPSSEPLPTGAKVVEVVLP